MNTRIIVVGIVCKGGEVLLGKKDKGQPPYPDVWHTIGGGVNNLEKGFKLLKKKEYDNSYFHSELLRELSEEAPNLRVDAESVECIIPKYRNLLREDTTAGKDNKPVWMIFLEYLCRYQSGDIKPGSDIVHLKWVKKKDLKKESLTPPSKEMYKELGWM
jgi:ADP-ribose pyrophosphatase YjhB (NUDIX family)